MEGGMTVNLVYNFAIHTSRAWSKDRSWNRK